MIIGIDGGCKWQGSPACMAVGVAVCNLNGTWESRLKFETEGSSSQRGEIMGLRSALEYIVEHMNEDESPYALIVTDSEYLYKTLHLSWLWKWANNNWVGSTGEQIKNKDLWEYIYSLFVDNPDLRDRIVLNYIKGHIYKYSQANFKRAYDIGKINQVAENLLSLFNRPIDRQTIIDNVTHEITSRGYALFDNDEYKLNLLLANTLADTMATYTVQLLLDSGTLT